jgi:hypothetical protein
MNTMSKKLFLTTLTFVICLATFAQETELDKRNGFKDIKLASHIDSVKGAKFKKDFKEHGHHVQLYSIEHPDYATIGEVKVESIEVKTYKGLIYEIAVITEKDERLMKGMEKALGKPGYNLRDESYNWGGQKLALKFSSYSKNQLSLMYHSYVVSKKMKEDKAKKIDAIADDF